MSLVSSYTSFMLQSLPVCFATTELSQKMLLVFFRGNPWIGSGEQPERDKHARDIPFLDNYSMERWEVGVHMHLIIIIFRLGHQSKF